jgi:hypothetical protein
VPHKHPKKRREFLRKWRAANREKPPRATRRAIGESWASAPIPGTTSSAAPAPMRTGDPASSRRRSVETRRPVFFREAPWRLRGRIGADGPAFTAAANLMPWPRVGSRARGERLDCGRVGLRSHEARTQWTQIRVPQRARLSLPNVTSVGSPWRSRWHSRVPMTCARNGRISGRPRSHGTSGCVSKIGHQPPSPRWNSGQP